jgi:EAL domain-containing protein (putative c-di-GMP-specific phosphodiesterase class I)
MPKEKKKEEMSHMKREYLKMKSMLLDKNTDLLSFLMYFDDIRRFLGRRRQIGVIYVETGNLAIVESLYGWQVFEKIIKKVSIRLREMKRKIYPPTSILSVNGCYGDQFILFIPETLEGEEVTPEYLLDTSDKISADLSREFLAQDYLALAANLSFNIGCSLLQESPFYRLERLIFRSLEEARSMPLMKEERKNARLSSELKRIISDGNVSTVFQEIMDIQNMNVIGYEAFSRGPKGTLFEKPGVMFAISHRNGLSVNLDRLCRERALKNAKNLPKGSKLFLNLHPESMKDAEWLSGSMEETLWSSNIRREDLILELPEKSSGEDPMELEKEIRELHEKGFSIAFDNIGTGYSSFQSISEVRPDYLKMDITLVRDIDKSMIKQDILKSIVQIAKRIDASVIAEGVETEEEFQMVKKLGVSYAQGYYFSYPTMSVLNSAKMVSRDH